MLAEPVRSLLDVPDSFAFSDLVGMHNYLAVQVNNLDVTIILAYQQAVRVEHLDYLSGVIFHHYQLLFLKVFKIDFVNS